MPADRVRVSVRVTCARLAQQSKQKPPRFSKVRTDRWDHSRRTTTSLRDIRLRSDVVAKRKLTNLRDISTRLEPRKELAQLAEAARDLPDLEYSGSTRARNGIVAAALPSLAAQRCVG